MMLDLDTQRRAASVRNVAASFGADLSNDVADADRRVALLTELTNAPEPSLPDLAAEDLTKAIASHAKAKATATIQRETAASLLATAHAEAAHQVIACAPGLVNDVLVPAFESAWETVRRLDAFVGTLTDADLPGVSQAAFADYQALGVAAHRLDQVLRGRSELAIAIGEPIVAERHHGSIPVLAARICSPPDKSELVRVFADVSKRLRELNGLTPSLRWREVLKLETEGRLVAGLARVGEPMAHVQAWEAFKDARWALQVPSVYV
jgi:hypothetical protein